MLEKWDGHTHTEFCPHGGDEDTSAYLDRAVELGFAKYSVTEHSPLPSGWVDEGVRRFLAMEREELPAYLEAASGAKARYEGRIEVLVGLELDYLPGREDFTLGLVEESMPRLDEALISVHYLPGKGGMRNVNYTPEDFEEGLVGHYGSTAAVIEEYFDHVEAALEFASGLPVPVRLAHPALIRKFRLALPGFDDARVDERLRALLPKLEREGIGLDANTSGLEIPSCGEAHVPEWMVGECLARGIRCVYGTDAHAPHLLGSGWEWFEETHRRLERTAG